MRAQAHIYIKGDVIGVGFRAWTKIQAKMLDVTGWIRNVHDKPHVFGRHGGVEAMLQGGRASVEKLIEIISQGPAIARVDDVEVYWQEPKQIFTEFEIRK